MLEGAEEDVEYNPDGSLRSWSMTARRAWRHVRTVIRHPEATGQLQWDWVHSSFGRIGIVGLETDPDPDRSCQILAKAIPLLRDYEWRGERAPGRPALTDADVRRDLEMALQRCRDAGVLHPSLAKLAEEHLTDRPSSETGSLTEATLRERMRTHPGPFRELVPWVKSRPKR
jgi:hypothetical protein